MDIQPLQMLIAVVCEASPSKSHSPIHKAGSPACSQHRCTHDFFFFANKASCGLPRLYEGLQVFIDPRHKVRSSACCRYSGVMGNRPKEKLYRAPPTKGASTGQAKPSGGETAQGTQSHPEERLYRTPRAGRRSKFTGRPEPIGGETLQGIQSHPE
jgi:hypothetical protein